MFSTTAITEEQLHAMWRACSEISVEPDPLRACQRLSERLTEIIAAPTAVFRRQVSPWKLIATAPAEEFDARQLPELGPADLDPLSIHSDDVYRALSSRGGTHPWTPVPLDEETPSQSLLLLPGDWRTGTTKTWLPRFARTASLALRLTAARQAARHHAGLTTAAYTVARKLGQITGDTVLHQFIVDSAADTAKARLAAISVYQETEGSITVAATHGYPAAAVGDVRIAPGSGIIGGVFASKKPLLVKDTTRVPGLSPRSRRYQTKSFMALPIVSGDDALGVVTLADRHDGRPFSKDDLASVRVVLALSALALVKERLTRLSDELAHTAAVDPLTGMFNRRYLEKRLDTELERGRRTGEPVALLMLDVDSFKRINDTLGHQAGDAVLRKVADIIRRSLRVSDVSTRYGGDEFCVIVPENAASAPHTAERIRRRVESFRWDTLSLPEHARVTISIGVSVAVPGESPDGLLRRGDQNLYEAKSRGRNQVFAG